MNIVVVVAVDVAVWCFFLWLSFVSAFYHEFCKILLFVVENSNIFTDFTFYDNGYLVACAYDVWNICERTSSRCCCVCAVHLWWYDMWTLSDFLLLLFFSALDTHSHTIYLFCSFQPFVVPQATAQYFMFCINDVEKNSCWFASYENRYYEYHRFDVHVILFSRSHSRSHSRSYSFGQNEKKATNIAKRKKSSSATATHMNSL